MKYFRIIIVTAFVVSAWTTSADVSVHDWKFLGTSQVNRDRIDFFYLPDEAKHTDNGHLLIWVKLLAEEKVTKITDSINKHKDLLDAAAKKIAAYYAPPYVAIHKDSDNAEGAARITTMEVIADSDLVTPHASFQYELDCGGRQYRYVAGTSTTKRGELQTFSESGAWEPAVPDSVVEGLFAVMCPAESEAQH